MEMNIEQNEVLECRILLDKIRKAITARDLAITSGVEMTLHDADNDFFHNVAALVENYWQGE